MILPKKRENRNDIIIYQTNKSTVLHGPAADNINDCNVYRVHMEKDPTFLKKFHEKIRKSAHNTTRMSILSFGEIVRDKLQQREKCCFKTV